MATFRDIQRGYDPNAQLDFTRGQAQQVGQSVPDEDVSSQILRLLQQYQRFGRGQLAGAQQEQARRLGAETPKELIGASPTLQSQVRSAQVGALEPTIGGAKDLLTQVKDVLTNYESTQAKARDDARAVLKDAFTIGGADSLKNLAPEELTALEKAAGYPKGYIQGVGQTLKERELQLKKERDALTGGLNAGQINTTVNQIRNNFDNEQIVKDYNSILGQVQFARTAEKTPTDDISRIYVFAKIMDPNSVVREGEYATVQQYATSLLQRYGLQAARIFDNRGFLTDQARKFLLNTIERKLKVSESQYNNLAKEYQRQIDDARAGRPPQITQYSFSPTDQSQTDNASDWRYVPPQSQTQQPRFSSGMQTTTPSFLTNIFGK